MWLAITIRPSITISVIIMAFAPRTFRDRLRKALQVARQSTVGVLFEGAFSAGARHDIASSITIFIRTCIAAAVHGALSRNMWALTPLRIRISRSYTPAHVSYVNATCYLAAELFRKSGCLCSLESVHKGETKIYDGGQHHATHVRCRVALRDSAGCVYACVVGARSE